jgi:hypothetical protein
MIGVGTLATGVTAEVDPEGTIRHGPVRVGWCVRSGNDWFVPGADSKARQSRPHPAPVVHTSFRIRHGDAIQRVYAVGDGDGDVVVIEVENDSPDAIAVGFVVDAPGSVTVALDGVRIDGAVALQPARRAGAVEPDHGLVFPVPHRTKVRVALARTPVDVGALADADAVARAWERMLDRGMRTELPEELQGSVDAARADLLLAPPSADTFATLESWGFDEDAAEMWAHLPMRARRAARRASKSPAAGLLGEIRAALVRESAATIELVPGFRTEWLGRNIAAHDVPLRRGSCSFAVRWHGARPAVLWDVPAGSTVSAPALDPAWSSNEPVGEALLGEPPATLLAMGEGTLAGTAVDAPDQFT